MELLRTGDRINAVTTNGRVALREGPSEGGWTCGGRGRGAMSDVLYWKGLTSVGLRLLVNRSRVFHIVAFWWGKWGVGGEFGGSVVRWGLSRGGADGREKCSQDGVDGRSWDGGPPSEDRTRRS